MSKWICNSCGGKGQSAFKGCSLHPKAGSAEEAPFLAGGLPKTNPDYSEGFQDGIAGKKKKGRKSQAYRDGYLKALLMKFGGE